MDRRWVPVAVGLATGLLLTVAPDGTAPLVVIVGALAAGWVLAEAPMVAAVLYLAPTVALGAVRLALGDDVDVGFVEGFLLLTSAVVFVGIFTHVGAGIALQRARRSSPGPKP